MFEKITNIDRLILHKINHDWHCAFGDAIFPLFRNSDAWVPLYLFMVVFMLVNFRLTGYWWVLTAIITVALANFVSSDLIKGNIPRLRPCNDPANFAWIRIIDGLYLPKSSSFTSSHATNHFAIAVFIFHTLKAWLPRVRYLFLLWAVVIVYAQMYVGVHYPSDILCGALIGILLGTLSSKVFQRNIQLS